jgi:hypothetical protein
LDELNLDQLYNQYRNKHHIPGNPFRRDWAIATAMKPDA